MPKRKSKVASPPDDLIEELINDIKDAEEETKSAATKPQEAEPAKPAEDNIDRKRSEQIKLSESSK